MKKVTEKIISAGLAAVMLSGMFQASVLAAKTDIGTTVDGIKGWSGNAVMTEAPLKTNDKAVKLENSEASWKFVNDMGTEVSYSGRIIVSADFYAEAGKTLTFAAGGATVTVTGSGKPYDNAEDEPMGDYWQITNIVNGVANKPTQRYETGMDDFYLISDSKEYLQDCLKKITAYLSTLHLTLNDKTEIVSISKGIRFLGFHTYITEDGKIIRRLTGENKRAIKKRLRKYYKLVVCGKMTRKEFNEKYQSWRNHASHGNCIKLLCDMDDYVAAMFGEDKMEKRIIIAGSRSFNDYSYFENWLAVYLKQFKDKQIKIISGGATGADKFAERYAKEHNIPLRLFYAKWEKYGKGAGYIRNSDMLEYAVKSDDNCLISVSLQGPFLALCVNGSGKKSRK